MCSAHWHSAHCAQCTLCSEISLSPLLLQWPTGIRGNITGSRSSGWNDKILRATRLHFDSFSLFPQNFPSTNLNPISSNHSYLKKSSKLNSDCRCEVIGLWLTQLISLLAVDSYLDIFQNIPIPPPGSFGCWWCCRPRWPPWPPWPRWPRPPPSHNLTVRQ